MLVLNLARLSAAAAMVVYFVWAMSSYGVQGEEVGRALAIFTAFLTGTVSLLMVVNIPTTVLKS